MRRRTGQSSGRLARIRSPPPLTAGVDMTSAVKYHGDARIGRAVASSGLVPVRARRRDREERDRALAGDTEIAPPLAIVDSEPSTARGFVGRRGNALMPPAPEVAHFMVRTRATGRDGACNCDGRSC